MYFYELKFHLWILHAPNVIVNTFTGHDAHMRPFYIMLQINMASKGVKVCHIHCHVTCGIASIVLV